MRRHLLLTTILGLSLASAAFADKNPRTGEELAAGQAYAYRMLDSVKSLDPQLISSVEDSDVARGIFEGLYNEDGDGNLVPTGAVSYTVSDDLKTYTFKLRHAAKWSNGDPVTAADYVYGWQRLVDPALASEYAYYMELAQVANAKEITAARMADPPASRKRPFTAGCTPRPMPATKTSARKTQFMFIVQPPLVSVSPATAPNNR